MYRVMWRAGLLLVAVSCMLRTSTVRPASSRQAPQRDYPEAVAQIAQQWRVDDSAATPSGRSVFLTRGRPTRRAVVLLHGFGNSPQQFRGLADSLYADGSNVWVPRLPYHAARGGAAILSRLTANDLRSAAESAADIGDGLGDSVFVLGFSMGGVAAAWIAQHRPDVERVVIVSPALALAHVPTALDRPLVGAMLLIPDITHGLVRDSPRTDRALGWSTHAVAQILQLGISVELDADHASPAVKDIRVLVNAHDRTINADAAVALATRWAASGAGVGIYQLPDSLHLPHDFIDATEVGGRREVVRTILEALVRDTPLPGWLARLRVQPKSDAVTSRVRRSRGPRPALCQGPRLRGKA